MEVDFTDKIKNIFDVCDTEGTGYITVEHLKSLAREHFGADSDEETIGIIHLLDPEGKGKVNFQDFCKGVEQIFEVQAQLKQSGDLTPTNSGTHADFINSFLITDLSSSETQDASEASAYTFNEYDTTTDEDKEQLLIDFSTPETSRRNLFPSRGHSSGRSSISKTDEENFEDYGLGELESDSSDNLSCDSCHRARRSPRHSRHKGNKHPPTRNSLQGLGANGMAKVETTFTGGCGKLIVRTNRLKREETMISHKRISSAAYASKLGRGLRSPQEDIYDDIDGSFQELTDRIKSLEKQLVKVTDEKQEGNEVKTRFKDENSILIKRIHSLEEQLKDMEVKSDEKVREEQRKLAEITAKHGLEGEKMDYLTLRLQTVETENDRLKGDVLRLKNDNDRLRMDKMEVLDRLAIMEEDYNKISAEYNEMMGKFDREREVTGNLLDELQKELEELRNYKIDCDKKMSHLGRSSSLTDSNGYSTLQMEMAKLRDANRHLEEENEELNAQILAQAVREGRHMLQEGNSMAEELDQLTKEELMGALKDQQDVNFRMKQYVDKIILAILEKHPAILEVT